MNPAFQDLDLYQEIFAEKATAIIKSMELTENGVVPNINKFMQKLTLDVLGKAIFGHEFHSIEGSTASDLKSYNHIMEAMFSVKYLIFGRIYERFPNSPFMKNMNDSVDNIHQLFRALIKDAKAKLDLKNEKKRSMLEYLVQANMSNDEEEHLDDDELITNIGVFFLAGHETTSTALSYEITLLAKNPEIQEKLRKEINVSIPGEMNKENLAKCEFLNAFIKESMRCYPPVAVVPSRKAAKDSVLGDWNIPAGTRIALNFLAVHMSKESYGDPENFRPERWLSEEQAKKKIPNNAWIPFSTGSRVCIGNNFSLYEVRTNRFTNSLSNVCF
jgi:cytochrome P450